MTKEEIRYLVQDLIEELRKFSNGTEITSAQLLTRSGYDPGKLTEEDLFEYHETLFIEAERNHIILDMSKHENKVEGLPWNLDFMVLKR